MPPHYRYRASAALLLLYVAAPAAGLGYDCNPLSDRSSSCALPWPDDFFFSKTWDPSAPPGLTLQNTTLPVDDSGNLIDPVRGGYDKLNGFSPLGPIMAFFPSISLELSNLPRLWTISNRTTNGNVVLLNTRTGIATPLWVELDHSGDSDSNPTPYERALLIWPALRLQDATQYIIALRNLVDASGIPVSPSDGFYALVHNISSSNPALEASRARFEGIFQTLAGIGWSRNSLSLAWSFTTNTQTDITSTMLYMRDDALARVARGVTYTISSIDNNPGGVTARRVKGQYSVPCYLPNDAVPSLDSRLVLDKTTGMPVYQNNVFFDFEVVIPQSLANGSKAPAGVLAYGHGLFGDASEVEEGYLATQANANGWVMIGHDWIGLSQYDALTVGVMIAESFTDFALVPDRLHQGMLNGLILMRMLAPGSKFLSDASLAFPAAPAGVVSNNASQRYYTGNSLGGIMGGVYMTVTTDVVLGVLGVAGAPFSVLLPRSTDFADLFDILKLRYPRSIDLMVIMGLIQALWDRLEGSGYVGYITAPGGAAGGPGVLPNTPSHRVIWQYGLGDAQVPWVGAHAVGLSGGAVMYSSNVREGNESISEFPLISDDTVVKSGNVIVGFDYGFPVVPFDNRPPTSGYDAHECVRRTPAAQQQMARFFATGEIYNACGGPCKYPPPGNCGVPASVSKFEALTGRKSKK